MIAPRQLLHGAGAALSVCAVGAVTLFVSGCTSSTPPPAAPSLSAITSALAQHAAALRDGDRAAFLAGVSDAPSAAAFRARQAAQFAALRSVPLSTWSYAVAARTAAPDASALAKHDGGPITTVRLTLRYALRGFDARPTEHDLWWTFVRRGDAVVAASDDDLAAVGGASWRGPWDFGPLVPARANGVLVLAHPDAAAAAPTIAQTVAAAVPAVSAVWGAGWSRRVVVLVPSTAAELTADVGQTPAEPGSTAALAVSDGTGPNGTGVAGQRLVVEPAVFARLSAIGRTIVVRHEVTHLATAAITGDLTPRWLVEGFADYVGNLGTGQPVRVVASELAATVRAGRVPSRLPADATFDTPASAAEAYEESWLACRLIARRAGQDGLVRFYRLVGASPSTDPLPGAVQAVLHESVAVFTTQWRAYLQQQVRSQP